MPKQIQDMIAHVLKIRAEADDVITELERMAEEAVGGKAPDVPHSKARGPQFVVMAKRIIESGGDCINFSRSECNNCPFAFTYNPTHDLCHVAGFSSVGVGPDPILVESARQYLRDCGEEE